MFEEQESVVGRLAEELATIEPAGLSDEDAVAGLALASRIERMGAGLRLRLAHRAAQSRQWHEEGYRSEAAWVAAMAGSSIGEARSALATATRLAELPQTCEAVRSGSLSSSQIQAVVAGASADPAAEPELLLAADVLSVDRLRQVAREVRAASVDSDPDRQARLRRSRYLRFWTRDDMLHLSGAVPVDAGAELVAAVRARAAFVSDEAVAAGLEPEDQEAYDADALVALAVGDVRVATFSGNAGGTERQATIAVHVGADGGRGQRSAEAGRCEIPGAGPVPETTLQHLLGDAMVLLVLGQNDGATRTVPLGPAVPAETLRSLSERDPVCVVPGCSLSIGLVTDVWRRPSGRTGPDLADLARLCRFHHRQKCHEGFQLVGGPDRWEWRGPP